MSSFGALPVVGGVRFRVWAPDVSELLLILHDGRGAGTYRPGRDDEGMFDLIVEGAASGDRYAYRLDGGELRPDPASRFQPEGVHGPSTIVDPSAFVWHDSPWVCRPPEDLVVYELHVGTFSPEGTFAGAANRLRHVRDLGATAIELMPVADFPGARNWGYDGVCLFAPARAYGHPDDLRRLVDEAHRLGISVLLDVVYNHVGPEGAYLIEFNPQHLTDRHATPWGRAVNLDGPGSLMVRRFIIDNALHWIREYHFDGLRLDATHALIDDSPVHILRELTQSIHAACERPITIHAEDHRNLAIMVEDAAIGGWGLDGVWADDFHHAVRRRLAGDSHGYYAEYAGTTCEIARILRMGWLFTGERTLRGEVRGTDPSAIPMRRFVFCLQNHDQVGNRATGDRLHHVVAPDVWRAASAILMLAPATPLLFMGQEWSASTPFQYFTDLNPATGREVTEGRRREFGGFPEFASPAARERIPDPQAPSTFAASRLQWDECLRPPHAAVLALYRALLTLRLDHRGLRGSNDLAGTAFAPDEDSVVIRRSDGDDVFWIAARLRGEGTIDLAPFLKSVRDSGDGAWETLLTTEEPLFAPDPAPPDIDPAPGGPTIRFKRPGAVMVKRGSFRLTTAD